MFSIQLPFFNKTSGSKGVDYIEHTFGDEFAHGRNQVASSWQELEEKLHNSEDFPVPPVCFLVHAPGFWETELNDLYPSLDEHDTAKASLPLYVYCLKETSGYKVMFSSRFYPEFFEKVEPDTYYSDLFSEALSYFEQTKQRVLMRHTYSSDLFGLLKTYQKAGYGVYKVL